MNTDKAYLLGLVIGGGIFGNAEDVFRIRLPYKQWGSYEQNPQRAGLSEWSQLVGYCLVAGAKSDHISSRFRK